MSVIELSDFINFLKKSGHIVPPALVKSYVDKKTQCHFIFNRDIISYISNFTDWKDIVRIMNINKNMQKYSDILWPIIHKRLFPLSLLHQDDWIGIRFSIRVAYWYYNKSILNLCLTGDFINLWHAESMHLRMSDENNVDPDNIEAYNDHTKYVNECSNTVVKGILECNCCNAKRDWHPLLDDVGTDIMKYYYTVKPRVNIRLLGYDPEDAEIDASGLNEWLMNGNLLWSSISPEEMMQLDINNLDPRYEYQLSLPGAEMRRLWSRYMPKWPF
jgi:hypothetical protein